MSKLKLLEDMRTRDEIVFKLPVKYVRLCRMFAVSLAFCVTSLLFVVIYENQRRLHHLVQPLLSQQSTVNSPATPSPRAPWIKWKAQLHPELMVHPWTGKTLQPLMADMKPFTQQSDYDYLQNHIISAGLNISRIAQLKVDYEPLDIEKELLSEAALTDALKVPNESYTKVAILNPKPTHSVGQTVAIRIDIYNGYGHPMARGGDVIWVWLTEKEKGAALAAHITDFRNGTYLAEAPVLWIGQITIKVSVRYPRESLRALLYTRHTMKSLRYVAAGYVTNSDSESTLCLPFPRIPGYHTLCNFTARNHGQSWYCGHPRKPSLRCADWVLMRDLEFPKPLPLTAAEDVVLSTALQKPVPRLVHQNLTLLVTSGQQRIPPPCDPFNHTHTWFDQTPRGYFFQRTWIPTACTVPPPLAELWLHCLRDTTVVMAGDSNLLMWFSRIKQRINCEITRARQDAVWHTPLTCRRPDINFTMSWKLHGYPEHPNSNHWAELSDFTSVCERIDSVPAVGKHIVIIHMYIHFTIHHYSILLNRLKCVKRAIEELLRRNPNARVLIRAPHHAYHGWNPIYGGDMTVPIYVELLRREFRGLYNRVVFLNLWDMSVAGENTDYHPDEWIDQQMVNFALSHACNMAPALRL
ncbi:hypothetical protein RRG08_043425 [Elysia crispata]|uniref:NXPE C-terminal domain-containing protein n=1 Tax=Elysia crispata TaxID=231223 RepID=A0AAE0YLY6_9GAST|nr:hypothetical protein RRG08_043425 [Elysia crispata]